MAGQLTLKLAKPARKPKRGRPRKYKKGDERHVARPRFEKLTVVHVTLKVTLQLKSLRRRSAYQAIRRATHAVLERSDFRIVHMSLERDHVHLIVEAANTNALSRGMQAFQISAAQRLNRALTKETGREHKGEVFVDRYHARLLTSPTQTYRALNYVLNNWRKHGEHRNPSCANWTVDYFSTAPVFDGWHDPPNLDPEYDLGWEYEPLPVHSPTHWFLTAGWKRVGSLRFDANPGRGTN